MKKRNPLIGSAIIFGAILLTGCSEVTPDNGNSDADKAQYNIMMDAEEFKVQRTIIAQGGLDGEIFMMAEGRCSFEYPSDNRVDIVCKVADNQYKRDTLILGDQDRVYIAQEEPIDVSVYHTRVIFKPESVLPEFDISIGQQ